VCALHRAQLLHTILHRTDQIICLLPSRQLSLLWCCLFEGRGKGAFTLCADTESVSAWQCELLCSSWAGDVPQLLPFVTLRRQARLLIPTPAVPQSLPQTRLHLRLRLRLEHAQSRTYLCHYKRPSCRVCSHYGHGSFQCFDSISCVTGRPSLP